MPHRTAQGPLRERREEILNRLAAIELQDDGDDERARLLRELDEVRLSLELITPPRPHRFRVRVVRGCEMSWDMMVGDARVRHCGACDREVYDLRAMDPDEVEHFIASRRDDLPCVQMYARPDGRYQDGPCAPAGRRLARACATAASLGLAGLITMLSAKSSAVEHVVPAPLPERPAPSVVEPALELSPWDVQRGFDYGSMGGGLVYEAVPYHEELRALETRLWADPDIARGAESGSVALRVTIDTDGRVRARISHAGTGLRSVALRAVRAARRMRAPFRPDAPVTADWVQYF